MEDHGPCEFAAAAVEEDNVFAALFDLELFALAFHVEHHGFLRRFADGHEPFFVALADDADEAVGEMEPRESQFGKFADTEPAAVQHFDDGFVAMAFGLAQVNAIEDGLYFRDGEHRRQFPPDLGRVEQLGGVFFYSAFEKQEVVKSPDARDDACLRTCLYLFVIKIGHKLLQVLQGDLVERLLPLQEIVELVDVAHVGVHRPGRQ